ncbi:hypothetical protein EDD11_003702 [Mortierella claussenii]|nr:hypothetical protein EDD11_003702 [Mortierella claussenii]
MPVPTTHVSHSSDPELHSFIRSAAAQALQAPQLLQLHQQQQPQTPHPYQQEQGPSEHHVNSALRTSFPNDIAASTTSQLKSAATTGATHNSSQQQEQQQQQQQSTSISAAGSRTSSTAMKTDRKADPLLPASVPITLSPSSTALDNNNSHQDKNASNNHIRKRKAATSLSERRKSAGGAHHVSLGNADNKKRASIDEHKSEEEKEGLGGPRLELLGNMRKRRVLAAPRTALRQNAQDHVHSPPMSASNQGENDKMVDHAGDMGVNETATRTGRKTTVSAAVDKPSLLSVAGPAATKPPISSHRRGSAAEANTKLHSPKKTRHLRDDQSDRSKENSLTTTIAAGAVVFSSSSSNESKVHKGGKSKATTHTSLAGASSTTSPSSASVSTSESGLQKRVLPTRGRDKSGGLPIEPSLLEPPIAPIGEYILYLADQQVFDRTTIDLRRVPPAAYNGGPEDHDSGNQSTSISESSTSALAPSAAISNILTSSLASTPPPSATTHIEVPIFKPCSINQYLQEEKKRRMQLLSKALAKAEAEAAAEALTGTNTASSAGTPSRTVSTRQKHKEIVNNQHVSVQTAAPSSSSSHSTSYGSRRATTTNTTLGRIEGVVVGGQNAAQEEILTDEVYEKRHRKQEMAEKKVKNREKEKLRHAMYQQQLVVEKLRHIDINRLMPISAFRSLSSKTVDQNPHHGKELASPHREDSTQQTSTPTPVPVSISLAAAKIMQDEYHRRLLREAEENLRRYEQLGLGEHASTTTANAYSPFSRTRNRLMSMQPPSITTNEGSSRFNNPAGRLMDLKMERKEKSHHQRSDSSASISRSESGDGRSRKRLKTMNPSSTDEHNSKDATASRSKPGAATSANTATAPVISLSKPRKISSQKTSSSSTVAAPTEVPPRPPKPITTFIKPGSVIATGGRKSSRVALAFGEKVPILERVDFDLPMDLFGDLIRAKFGEDAVSKAPPLEVKSKRGQRTWPPFVGPSTRPSQKRDEGAEATTGASKAADAEKQDGGSTDTAAAPTTESEPSSLSSV